MKKQKNNWNLFSASLIICISISTFFYYLRNLHWEAFICFFDGLLFGTINYKFAQLGVFVLTTSLIGITLVLMIFSKPDNKYKQNFLPNLIMSSYIFAIFFSSLKLILNASYKTNFCKAVGGFKLGEIGHLSFIFLIIGIFSFVIWITKLQKGKTLT